MVTPALLLLAVLLLPKLCLALFRTLRARARRFTITGAYIIDGDTLAHGKLRLRLAGIDAPEIAQDGGPAAKRALQDLAARQSLRVDPLLTDRYGRTVARVAVIHPDGSTLDLAGAMVAQGFARADRASPDYLRLEHAARKARRGLWATPNGIPNPAAFRRARAA